MAIDNILEIGRSGLLAQQEAMQTTSNNISNVNTKNYSRQRAELNARGANTNFGWRASGGGVDVGRTIRIHDQFIQRQVLEEAKSLGNLKARAESLDRIEGIAHHGLTDLGERANEFFSNFRELSLNPELPALRVAVKESAVNLTDGFRKTADSLENLRNETDLRISATVDEVNLKAQELAELNKRITGVPANQEPPHELMDRRDGVVSDLAKMLGVSISYDDRNDMNIVIPGVGILVHGGEHNELSTSRTPGHGAEDSGNIDLFLKTPTGFQYATRGIPDGELGGLLKVRDETITKTLESLDRVAHSFMKKVNEIHRGASGLDWDSDFAGDFFETKDSSEGAAYSMKLSSALEKDPSLIMVGYESNAPSDNRVALEISSLQDERFVMDGASKEGATLNESINSILSGIASQTHGSRQIYAHQSEIMDQLENYQKSVSGVSLEEEAVNMMQYQAAFNAAAKTMHAGDEMLETILNLV
ncbi:MAG: flagellar hook-associated protein FlgK [Bdellovibrionales bacterium]|nr:flagellar hook-associated protein FlgK [Bdellovibrionales bacterium]